MGTPWYVMQVRAGSEPTVCKKILKMVEPDLYESVFVPMIEMVYKQQGEYKKVWRAMFPGYLFVISDRIDQVHYACKQIVEMTKILRGDLGFQRLPDDEVSFLLSLYDDYYQLGMSEGVVEHDKIVVTKGPLCGHEGSIRKIDRHKRIAFVEMAFLGQTTLVRMPLEIVSKI